MIDSRIAYSLLVGVIALERLAEVELARRNDRRLRAAGAVEEAASSYPLMVALHTAFPVACLVEVWGLSRPWRGGLAAAMLAALALAMALRGWVVATLGPRWTTRVLVVPGAEVVTGGPYRLMRHPNYVAVAVEMAALPLVHGAWITAVVFSALNGMMLAHRVRAEEAALARWCVVPDGRADG